MINEAVRDVLKERYLHPGEKNEHDMFRRVVNAIIKPLKSKKKELAESFLNALEEGTVMPNSPALMNLGGDLPMASACFVLPLEDSMHGIFESLHNVAMVHKMGGGTGLCFSSLRPTDSLVKSTNGKASGPLSFLKVFDAATNVIKQGGKRRGANMATFDVGHPNVFDFITIKDKEGEISNFNLSVMLTDKFMESVKNNQSWELKWQDKVYQTVQARDLFDTIVRQSWKNGEPGILFIDTINREQVPEGFTKDIINCTNPCFSGDCFLSTKNGYEQLKYLDGKEVIIKTPVGNVKGKVWKTGVKKTITLKCFGSNDLKVTPNHIIMTSDGREIQAKDTTGERLRAFSEPSSDHNLLWVKLGYIQGDGNLGRLKSKYRHKGLEINIGENDDDILKLFNYERDGRKYYTDEFTDILKKYEFSEESLPYRTLPTIIDRVTLLQLKSFLRGLYSANGSVITTSRIALKSTCKKMIEKVQSLLLLFDIDSYITTNKTRLNKFKNGEYMMKESYDLNIGQFANIVKFYEEIGFVHSYKTESLLNLLIERCPKVYKIEENTFPEEVYDFSAPGVNWGFVNDFVVHNCGEQPLADWESCNLAAINLGLMVKKNDKDQYEFDYEKFEKNIELIIQMLDMILDVNKFPLPQIEKKSLESRRIGAGIMGFADLLIKLHIKYGSPECIELVHNIMSFYKEKANAVSIAMGGGKRKHKALLTIAPTGTTSMFCNASSGIEPYFNYYHERVINDKRVLVFEGIVNDKISEDQKQYIIDCSKNNIPVDYSKISLPEYFVRSLEIPWQDHIKVQAAFQQYVDSSISKTVGLPNSATEKDVADAIFMAWELKCKGLTVYRDGSREKQVLNNIGTIGKVNDPDGTIVHGEITLPQEMDAKTYRIKASLGKEEPDQSFYIHIGLIKGRPVQLFIDYKRQSDNATEANQLKAQMIESLGMSISYQMRYGVPLTVIIKQLKKIPFSWMMSLHVQIANILSKYLDQTAGICEKCKGKIEYKEGCRTCPCGHSNGCDH
jgi:ribonucleoside-diphosphate reductase alpha chain